MQWDLRTALNTFHIFSFRGLAPGITGGDFRQVHNDGAPLLVGALRVGQKIDDVWRVTQGFRNFCLNFYAAILI